MKNLLFATALFLLAACSTSHAPVALEAAPAPDLAATQAAWETELGAYLSEDTANTDWNRELARNYLN